ncbi:hypothetical protein ACH4SK_07530 [Streptomyces inhibens]|uniref:hypothetical protein n=1 Tax=Streptomyces inhibens TaxID=2293571 RepID=UPI0037B4F2E1
MLSSRAQARAKSGDGPVQIARMFKLAMDSAVKIRTQAVNQLKAVLVTADPVLREELAGLNNPALVRTCPAQGRSVHVRGFCFSSNDGSGAFCARTRERSTP